MRNRLSAIFLAMLVALAAPVQALADEGKTTLIGGLEPILGYTFSSQPNPSETRHGFTLGGRAMGVIHGFMPGLELYVHPFSGSDKGIKLAFALSAGFKFGATRLFFAYQGTWLLSESETVTGGGPKLGLMFNLSKSVDIGVEYLMTHYTEDSFGSVFSEFDEHSVSVLFSIPLYFGIRDHQFVVE